VLIYSTKDLIPPNHDGHGTTIRFKADAEIFQETTVYDYEILARRLREQAFLNAGLSITLSLPLSNFWL